MKTEEVEAYFEKTPSEDFKRYEDYFGSLSPKTTEDFFQRFLFAITSVHSSWQANTRTYALLRDLSWMDDKDNLAFKLDASRGGMNLIREEIIWQFKEDFWETTGPDWFYLRRNEPWSAYRARLVHRIKGLGMAKVSFALEMCYPHAPVACLDRHMLRTYGHDPQQCSVKDYISYETHWDICARQRNVSAAIGRLLFWDKLQDYQDSRYWTCFFE